MYLVDPEGNFVDYFGQNKKAAEVATAVAIHMGSYERAEKNKTRAE
jgi:protein SCO1/2